MRWTLRRACRQRGVRTVAVTAGYITAAARSAFFEHMDAANVDLKGFTEEFYWKFTGGHLQAVLDTLRWLVHESDVWLEITNLVIPGANDDRDEIARMCDWVAAELGPEVPLHFSAFHPDFRLTDRGRTPGETLRRHARLRKAGLRYVYTGNVSDREHQNTYCPGCGGLVIERDGYALARMAFAAAVAENAARQLPAGSRMRPALGARDGNPFKSSPHAVTARRSTGPRERPRWFQQIRNLRKRPERCPSVRD